MFKRPLLNEAVVVAAKVRNPFRITAFEYSTFMAIKYLLDHDITQVDELKQAAMVIPTLANITARMQDFDNLMKKHKMLSKLKRDEAREEKHREKVLRKTQEKYEHVEHNEHPHIRSVKESKRTPTTSNTTKVKKTKKAPRAKKAKRI